MFFQTQGVSSLLPFSESFEGWEACSTKVDFIMQEKFTITPRLVQILVLTYMNK